MLSNLQQPKVDLKSKRLDTLQDFKVDYSFKVEEPKFPLGKLIILGFLRKAAIDLTTHQGGEYGFLEYDKPGATDLTKLNTSQLEGLSINILDCERDFAKLDHLANRSSKCSSKNFTA